MYNKNFTILMSFLFIFVSCYEDAIDDALYSLDGDLSCNVAEACVSKCQNLFSHADNEEKCLEHTVREVIGMMEAKDALRSGRLSNLKNVTSSGFLDLFEIDTDYFFDDLIGEMYNYEQSGDVLHWLALERDVMEFLAESSAVDSAIKNLLFNLNDFLDKENSCTSNNSFPSLPVGIAESMRYIYADFHSTTEDQCDECLDFYKTGTTGPYPLCGFDSRASDAFRFRVYKEAKGIVILPSLSNVASSDVVNNGFIYPDPLAILDVGSDSDLDLYVALSNKFSVLDSENILNFSLKQGNGPLLEILFEFLGIDSEGGGICDQVKLHTGITIPQTRSVKELCAKALFCYLADGDEGHALWDFLIKHPQGTGSKYGDSLHIKANQKFCNFEDLVP